MRPRRILAALLATAALVGAAGAAPAVASPAAAGDDAAALVVAPRNGGVVTAGRPVDVDVRVTNTSGARLPAGELAFSVQAGPVASTTELISQIADPVEVLLGQLLPDTAARTPALEPGASAEVRARITAKELSENLSDANGARILYVRLQAGSAVQVVAESALVKMSGGARRIGFGTVVPITAPPNATGVVDVDEQAELTGDDGDWTAALDAARAMPSAVVALDPEVIASIRLAGESAPASATAFLGELADLGNETVRLPYADGDVTLQRAAGLPGDRTDPASFASVSTAAPTAASPSPSAAPTPAATTAPGSAALTDWAWSDTALSWPVPGTTSAADLAALGRSGPVLLGSTDLGDTAARAAAGPLATVSGSRVLVADGVTSRLLAAATASDDITGRAALAPLLGALATDAVTAAAPAVLAVAGRGVDPSGAAAVLDLLDGQRWIRGESLGGLLQQDRAVGVGLKAGAPASTQVTTARTLIAGQDAIRRLASAVRDEQALLAPHQLALLGLLSAQWRGDDTAWSEAATAATASFASAADQVTVLPSDPRTLIGTDGTLQVTVANGLAQAVKVDVSATVNNGRLQFGSPTRVTVPAGARAIAKLGFRSIANGRAQVTLTLTTPDGATIATTSPRLVTVQAGFDTLIAVVLLTLLGLLLALGVYRNIIRRRRPRAKP